MSTIYDIIILCVAFVNNEHFRHALRVLFKDVIGTGLAYFILLIQISIKLSLPCPAALATPIDSGAFVTTQVLLAGEGDRLKDQP